MTISNSFPPSSFECIYTQNTTATLRITLLTVLTQKNGAVDFQIPLLRMRPGDATSPITKSIHTRTELVEPVGGLKKVIFPEPSFFGCGADEWVEQEK